MTIKEQIMEIIENSPVAEEIIKDNEGCFKNIILPAITQSNNDVLLDTVISMLIMQTAIYDALLNNIAQFSSKELVDKCNSDINNILALKE